MTEHVSQDMRAFHNKYSAFWDCMEAEQMVCLWTFHNGKYPETSEDHRKHLTAIRTVIPRKRSAGKLSLSSVSPRRIRYQPWVSPVERAFRSANPREIGGRNFIPGRIRARGWSNNLIKHGDPHRNVELRLTSQKWLIVNKKRLVIV